MAVATTQRPRPRPRTAAAAAPQNTQKIFDFTKRRRWTDVLLSSLPGAALLVLDKYGSIEYAGPGTRAVLGWEIEEVVERNVLEFVNDDDCEAFSAGLRRAIVHREELVCFTRLKRKPKPSPHTPISSTAITDFTNADTNVDTQSNAITSSTSKPSQDVILFDIRGHALYLDFEVDDPSGSNSNNAATESRYKYNTTGTFQVTEGRSEGGRGGIEDIPGTVLFFLMAKPYPSRNVAMLNAFLELKLENERLTQRLETVKMVEEAEAIAFAARGAGTSAFGTTGNPHLYIHPTGDNAFASMAYILKESAGGQGFDTERIRVDGMGSSRRPQSPYRVHDSGGEGIDERARRKKLKRAHDSAATDSPTSASPSSGMLSANINTKDRDRDRSGNKDKEKDKERDSKAQYVCYTCGRTDSPEWRRGPTGPKTLCNACGLRWAKHAKSAGGVNGLSMGMGGGVLGAAAAGYAVKGASVATNAGPDSKRPRTGMTSAGAGASTSALTRGAPQGPASGGTTVRERRVGGGRRERDGPVVHAGISVTPPELPPQAQLVQQQQQQQQQQQRMETRVGDTLSSVNVPTHTFPPPPPPPQVLGPVVPIPTYPTSHARSHNAALSTYPTSQQHNTGTHPSLQQAQQAQQQQFEAQAAHAGVVELDRSAPVDEYVYDFERFEEYGGYNRSAGGGYMHADGGHGHQGGATSGSPMSLQGYGHPVGTIPGPEHDGRTQYTLPHPHPHPHSNTHTQPDNGYGY